MNVSVRVPTGRFESVLHMVNGNSPANLLVTLHMRLFLQRIGTTTFTQGGKTFRTRPWTDPEWNYFTMMVRHMGESFWNDRYWLQPPAGYDELNVPLAKPAYRPNFKCKLQIQVLAADKKSDAHYEVRAVRLADDEKKDFRSDAVTWCHRDVGSQIMEDRVFWTIVHELGHLLGLDHPGLRNKVPACVKDGNKDECYTDRAEVMGAGHKWIPEYAQPWKIAAALHTKGKVPIANWTVLMKDTPPQHVGYNPVARTVTPPTAAPPNPIRDGELVNPFK